MLQVFFALLACVVCSGAVTLQLVKPAVSDIDGSAPNPAGFEYRSGQVVYFTCRISGYTEDKDRQVRLKYTVQAVDSHGVALGEIIQKDVNAEVTPQDKEWMPKVEAAIGLPSLMLSGEYKIVAKVDDLMSKTSATLDVPFKIRGSDDVQPSGLLVVTTFRFLRNEDDTRAAERAAYRAGDHLWAKFNITGFKYGPNNKIDVSYVTSIIGPDGKTLWTQPQPAGEEEGSFYPKPYIRAEMGIQVQPNIRKGDYQLLIQAKDGIGNQTCELKQSFTIE